MVVAAGRVTSKKDVTNIHCLIAMTNIRCLLAIIRLSNGGYR